MFAQPKIHKENIPIRPIISCINSPNSKLTKFLCSIFKKLEFKPKYSIKNRQDLIKNLNDTKISPEDTLVSFDITNLFTSIPIKESISIMNKFIKTKNLKMEEEIDIRTLIQHACEQNFFEFQDKIYKQQEGLPMGFSLSPILAEIFMDNLETLMFKQNHPIVKYVGKWIRYVDDILCIWKGKKDLIEVFRNFLNQQHKNIKFTKEIEVEKKLNFLDLTIIREDNQLKYGIYHKKIQTDIIINKTSIHLTKYKHSTFHSYINRLTTTPMDKIQFDIELNIIKELAYNNGYKQNLIDKILYNKQLKKLTFEATSLQPIKEKPEYKYQSLTYQGTLSNKIANILEKSFRTTKIAFKTTNKLNNLINTSKKKTSQLESNGVYKLECGECRTFYIGQTCRKLETRINEHINRPNTSAFGKHLKESGHIFDKVKNSKILHYVNKGAKLTLWEFLEIHKAIIKERDKCLNNHKELHLSYTPIFKNLDIYKIKTKEIENIQQ